MKAKKTTTTPAKLVQRQAPGVRRIRRIHQIQSIYRVLKKKYGTRKWTPRLTPVDQLVATILSQNTTDTNSGEAFSRLKDKFPKWEQAIAARVTQIAAAIRVGGLANVKAKRIKKILRDIRGREGTISLDCLSTMKPQEAMKYLVAFDGVGVKTAACVCLFSLGMPVLPVDTHVHRVAMRLGLIDETTDHAKAHATLGDLVSARIVYAFHLLMIEHGRQVCHARRPKCVDCPLGNLCPTGHNLAAAAAAAGR